MEAVRRPPTDRVTASWLRRIVVVAAGLGLAAVPASLAIDGDATPSDLFLGFAVVLAGVLVVAAAVGLIVRALPVRLRSAVLAATVLPALAVAGSLGLPESAIHFSGQAEWAFSAGREISVAALVMGAALAGGLAWVHAHRAIAVAAIAALTFSLAVVGRDLALAAQDQQPAWCYADQVRVGPDGAVATSGSYDGCTVLLPAREP